MNQAAAIHIRCPTTVDWRHYNYKSALLLMFVCLFVVSANAASTQAARWWHVGESVVAAKEGGNLACDEFTLLLRRRHRDDNALGTNVFFFFFFSGNFVLYPKWRWSDLSRFGYKPNMKAIKNKIPGLKFWLITSTMHINLAVFS